MRVGLIGYGKMNRLIEKALPYPVTCITRDLVKDLSADLYIDFSHHSCVETNALLLSTHNKCHLIGTTGWESPHVPAAYRKKGAGLFCPNFSYEMNRFLSVVRLMVAKLGPPDEATEWHHHSKADRPSGTAKLIASFTGVSFTSVRTEETIFKHRLRWGEITLSHEACDRAEYVIGAIRACEWLYGKQGWYDDFFGCLHAACHPL